ncbi:MAG: tRNA (adenosine(37)-N6)-threonylcarbamoyltransferase complex dimerization subunit type 1 TsaB [Candidatus Omnitrophica bacterium]|nr:tRNA (adenosine(37)-N6)-threonylcarbamoyltransferase complex dimerization subunit type 1 TsaB [Candidatus Omnitrophota bacterium]
MKILAVDTSTLCLSLAVADENKIVCEYNKRLKKPDHCRYLIPGIKDMLEKEGLKLRDMNAFCAGLGPGSFTGLRVGLAALKGLSMVLGKRLIGISSLDAIVHNIKRKERLVVCIQDARKGKVYSCLYHKNGSLERLTDYLLLEFKELVELVKKVNKKRGKKVLFTASGVEIFKDDILKVFPEAEFSVKRSWYPRASNLVKEAAVILKNSKCPKISADIEPLYLHSQYANITRPKKL